jgi:hypothetical protein
MKVTTKHYLIGVLIFFVILIGNFLMTKTVGTVAYSKDDPVEEKDNKKQKDTTKEKTDESPKLDTADYDKRLLDLAHYKPPVPISVLSTSTDTNGVIIESYTTSTPPSPLLYNANSNVTVKNALWPKSQPYPLPGAILPFKRILAYYGNFYSRHMGILGEYEPDEVLRKLAIEKDNWEKADPATPVLLAIEYIAMVAQADAGADGMYRTMMPDSEIRKAHELAKQVNGILILDMQIGLSTLEQELQKFDEYMREPDIHLALDPEFSMKSGNRPGTVIGAHSADDINYAINHLSRIVQEYNLPPKVLLVHRFTQNMVTDSSRIAATPEVQVVIVMDGWGSTDLKRGTYKSVIEPEPVQFAGIKIFYKNDLKPPSTGLFTPKEVLDLDPKPIYIQYQ